MHQQINGYKYGYTSGNLHIFYKCALFRVKLIEVTTSQVNDGTYKKLAQTDQYSNKQKNKR